MYPNSEHNFTKIQGGQRGVGTVGLVREGMVDKRIFFGGMVGCSTIFKHFTTVNLFSTSVKPCKVFFICTLGIQ